jgi:TrpR-related protein YerC/YecD
MHPISKNDIDDLYGAILTLRTKEEARKFLRDLCTATEIREFAERWKTARMIMDHTPYTAIIEKTGLSSTTVARVARWVKRGTGGYRMVLRRTGRRPG